MNLGDKDFHIAPMIDVSTVEFRYFIRLLTRRAVIWNQMVVAETLFHRNRLHKKESSSCCEQHDNDNDDEQEDIELTPDLVKFCGWYDDSKISGVSPHPTVCQIGSNIPSEAKFATKIVQMCGYDAIDLNSECPSDRVAGRCFGAGLMKDHDTSAKVVSAMVETAKSISDTTIPVSVKTRIGVDELEGFNFISSYIQRLVDAGCWQFIIHARKVYMEGLNPAENRTVPPLDYPCAYRLMKNFPPCSFIHNGGIRGLEHARKIAFGSSVTFDEDGNGRIDESSTTNDESASAEHDMVPCRRCNLPNGSCCAPALIAPKNLRGVMVGRLARDRPADLADVDRYFYGEPSNPCQNRRELMDKYIAFLDRVYPRRCCDDEDTVTLCMIQQKTFIPKELYCSICQEFRCRNGEGDTFDDVKHADVPPDKQSSVSSSTSSNMHQPLKQSNRRLKRHAKYDGAKIASRIIDRALQPTHSILAGEKGKKSFLYACHTLSRDKIVRNCGPAYILWKAMQTSPDKVWDAPFELTGEKSATSYYPTK